MKVIKKLKKSVLMENKDGYRFYVPIEVYEDEEITDYEKEGIPYSLSFDLILKEIFKPKDIQKQLYAQGIHTLEDVLSNRKRVNDTLKKALSAENVIKEVRK